MAAAMTLIIPTIVETQLTGFIGASERTIRGTVWRVEWWSGKSAAFKRNGKAVEWDAVKGNRSVVALMMRSHRCFTEAANIQKAAA